MKIYGLSDLHLSFTKDKPMTKFGPHWENHPQRIQDNWNRIIKDNDIVLVPGDLSWASKLEDALPDLYFIEQLRGRKAILKGNHDYWWQGIKKLKDVLQDSTLYPLRNDCILIDNVGIVGTRGFDFEMASAKGITDIYNSRHFVREQNRLEMSLKDAKKKQPKKLLAMMHYPPFSNYYTGASSPLTDMLVQAGVTHCVYGHLHSYAQNNAFQGEMDGIEYFLIAADFLKFKPKRII